MIEVVKDKRPVKLRHIPIIQGEMRNDYLIKKAVKAMERLTVDMRNGMMIKA